MPATAELIGALLALGGLGILTLCSVRSITRRRPRPAPAQGCPPRGARV
ncbi:hypothetical protein [Streptomyces cyanogenus]|uniref:LPXTG cell wall anchor domain-containing protein n=1 Tax=Streptomyces cyanogenus TaxID=80860 RepID=A0ABX7TYV5_STRCY|nr:hypothetical protein [Streptomyces cyanogenus]QTE01428.1 hypothetical protein S1361_29140 [Streptomyces cyanogenus]